MSTNEEIREKIKLLKNQIEKCQDDAKAILLQKQMIDMLKVVCQDKELLKEILLNNGN